MHNHMHVHDQVSARATVVLLSNGVTISVFCFEPQIMTLNRMCSSTLRAHPFTLKRGAKRRVPCSHLRGQQTAV